MARKNKGFSVVELLIVVAILIIVGTVTAVLLNHISYGNVLKAANKVNTIMDKVRLVTLAKDTREYLYIYNIDEKIYMKVSEESGSEDANLDTATGEKIGMGILVYYQITGGEEKLLEAGQHISIAFEKSTGSFTTDYEWLKFTNASKTAKVVCVKETGRHWVE